VNTVINHIDTVVKPEVLAVHIRAEVLHVHRTNLNPIGLAQNAQLNSTTPGAVQGNPLHIRVRSAVEEGLVVGL
jgi:hypothetical protein